MYMQLSNKEADGDATQRAFLELNQALTKGRDA